MDFGAVIKRGFAIALTGLVFASPVFAHPHEYTQQQALVSIGTDGVLANVIIMPGIDDAARIAAQLDLDGDGTYSDDEAAAFGADILTSVSAVLDDDAVELTVTSVTLPDPVSVSGGLAELQVELEAFVEIVPDSAHEFSFAVTFNGFDAGWFLQPFYRADFTHAFGTPSPDRSKDGSAFSLDITPVVAD